MTLTKAHIIDKIYENGSMKRCQSVQAVEFVLEIIKKTLENGEEVLISGFGKFYVQEKKSRRGRNPQNGKELMPGTRRVMKFRCSPKLKKNVNSQRISGNRA